MIGFTAIAVDLGAVYAQRAKLQNGADAAALAVAQQCAPRQLQKVCPGTSDTASRFVTANATSAASVVGTPTVDWNAHTATVLDSAVQQHWFAPVLGINSTTVRATATARWEGASTGTKALPLVFSLCEWKYQTAGGVISTTVERTIFLTKSSPALPCQNPSGNVVPGGFGYVDTTGGKCQVTSNMNDTVTSSTGNNPPAGCSPGDFQSMKGETVLLPIFDDSGQQGSSAWYHIYGYAAFKITGWYFGGQYSSNPQPCLSSDRCITGYFTNLVTVGEDFPSSPDAPLLGAVRVRLTR
jgi:hypothetical protein